ncbi:N-acetylglucosamine-6-phosphate deacetylase [Jiangella anatolica]|uniref:N-acetylglucosamine-6-phosphate deacetylase n=1 Tax=Jiangella anatolica TaxID=2670374 RepID=A0A2W2B848_9ACTN|nr:N-acetylglucosamine-6-phosphate deacetylase [Jiangella anatolica]PZF82282.1 N-acetylglucosamine-6-phosphate deacetylase [Jiangella anatolica]
MTDGAGAGDYPHPHGRVSGPPIRTALVGGTLLWSDGRLAPGTVVFGGGVVQTVAAGEVPAGTGPADAIRVDVVHDVTGRIVAPGFVDTHVHGGLGANFMTADADAGARISGWLAAGGVTSCLATTVSAAPERLERTLQGLAGLRGRLAGGRGVELLGVHVEGPFLNPAHHGVHSPEHLRTPSAQAVDALLAAGDGAIRVVTLAPELPGGMDAVARFAAAGVHPSLGHSAASFQQAKAAIGRGLDRAAHLFEYLAPMHHREPGAVPALLTDPRVRCELVADGVHVAPEMLRFAFDVAGWERILLVSNGCDTSGLTPGRHRRWDGVEVEVGATESRTLDGALAGSVSRLGEALRVLVAQAGVAVADALRMAAAVPAASLGLTDRGRLTPGRVADIVVLDSDLGVRRTYVRGDVVFDG